MIYDENSGKWYVKGKGFTTKEINTHDILLVNEAKKLSYTEWMSVRSEEAETAEGYESLEHIASRLYHFEEASCDNI